MRSRLFQSFRAMVRLSRDRTGQQGYDHLIEKNYCTGLCQLEVDDLFAAFGDLARVELALGRMSQMKKKLTGAARTGRTCDPTYLNPSAQWCAGVETALVRKACTISLRRTTAAGSVSWRSKTSSQHLATLQGFSWRLEEGARRRRSRQMQHTHAGLAIPLIPILPHNSAPDLRPH